MNLPLFFVGSVSTSYVDSVASITPFAISIKNRSIAKDQKEFIYVVANSKNIIKYKQVIKSFFLPKYLSDRGPDK